MKMKALIVEKDGTASIREVPLPEYGEYEALVKMQASAVCGTDMKIFANTLKGFSDYPTILGHEGVGEVVELGSKVKNLKIGDRVMNPMLFESLGGYYSTWGAMCEYAVVGDAKAYSDDGLEGGPGDWKSENYLIQRVVPAEIDPVAATMIVTFREVFAATRRFRFSAGQSIVIYGAGPVGMLFIKLCKNLGMGPIISVDVLEEREEQAKLSGADKVLIGGRDDVVSEIKKMFPDGVDVLLDAAGVTSLINQNLNLVKTLGKICIYGETAPCEVHMDWSKAPFQYELLFLQWPAYGDEASVHDEIIKMVLDGRLNGMDYISDVYPFEDAWKGIKQFLERKNKKKIVFKF